MTTQSQRFTLHLSEAQLGLIRKVCELFIRTELGLEETDTGNEQVKSAPEPVKQAWDCVQVIKHYQHWQESADLALATTGPALPEALSAEEPLPVVVRQGIRI